MALTPSDNIHALQIQAGALGRKTGHAFEDKITEELNGLCCPIKVQELNTHVLVGDPALLLLRYIAKKEGLGEIQTISSLSTGALATSEDGKRFLSIENKSISRCKSDLIITIEDPNTRITVGVSTKQCNKKTPTNAQLYFTTAVGFSRLLMNNGISVSDTAINALRQFCGDPGFRPLDDPTKLENRLFDTRRFFWEEIDKNGREEWEAIFSQNQNDVSRLLFQKAYLDDPFSPEYLLHKTKASDGWHNTEVAIYSINEIISLSKRYQGFYTKKYSVKKGRYKDPVGVQHLAPRFGIIQMQRGGQKQHPTQLQFNLEAGYFYKI
ncbi:hypothetical protein [Desulfohalobium retbaense]|uniref:Uncharacterized protein n=1 Tax=Desulfohalobium retbaense (strain ATCC 49708 / DSM 5692 / JCM 16813 / HR100) TaxID=485915 RepID=C8X5V6_DESRD|nr:hypothetical protein [Desulfohalobium retbaense]ACV69803.1 hypothetical protein Dret_2523 [Desulfohalobium retbaense DSM 5692]